MKVLLPIDGTDCSQKTIEWATTFLDKASSQIYLLYVIDLAVGVPLVDLDTQQALSSLENAKGILEGKGFKVAESHYIVDAPVDAICKYADETGIDQIVLGSHGKQGLAKFLLGSVSEGVFKHAKQQVLIHRNAQGAPVPMGSAS